MCTGRRLMLVTRALLLLQFSRTENKASLPIVSGASLAEEMQDRFSTGLKMYASDCLDRRLNFSFVEDFLWQWHCQFVQVYAEVESMKTSAYDPSVTLLDDLKL
uniref:Uncharacterized protein n=1 Tax=Arundo donax TaxID=35708 RepID=A0A0A9RDI3_ARUDO